jgi:hypothetical protein
MGMKKIGWINILFSIFLVTLAACTDDDGQDSSWHGKEMRVNLRVSVPAWTENTRAGSTSVEEGINDFQLLCFDKDGYFVGRRAVTFTSSQGTPSGGTLTGTVPSTTCRIHFIANGDFSSFNDTQSMGVNENTVVSALTSATGDQRMTYWGYKRFSTPDEMAGFLDAGTNVVYLLRDRAMITVESKASDITSVQSAVCHGLEKGTVAPFDQTDLSSPFTYDDARGVDFITKPVDQSLFPDPEEISAPGTAQYVFENPNSSNSPLVVILKVTYTDATVKYHKILLLDGDYNPIPVIRNHQYNIVVNKLAPELGYDSFSDALNGNASNNPFLYIEDIIPGVSDNGSTLTITNGTTQIFHSSGVQTIDFNYVSSGTGTSTSSFQAGWLVNGGIADQQECSVTSYDPSTGDGQITIKLNAVNGTPQFGTLYIKDKNGLIRKIHVVSVDNYQFGNLSLSPSSGVGTSAGQTVTLTFTIPDNYPTALMPLKVMFATNDLNATTDNQLGVSVESTSDIGQSWNFWYTFWATTKGTHTLKFETVRANTAGSTGTLYIRAADFETKELTFTY